MINIRAGRGPRKEVNSFFERPLRCSIATARHTSYHQTLSKTLIHVHVGSHLSTQSLEPTTLILRNSTPNPNPNHNHEKYNHLPSPQPQL